MVWEYFYFFGFGEIWMLFLEMMDLFCCGIGEVIDVVGKEMYSFQDCGDCFCILWLEGIVLVVCVVFQYGLFSQGVQKFWYVGLMFCYECFQVGWQWQFYQIGVEWFGVEWVWSDVEVIVLVWDLFVSLGVGGLQLELNSFGIVEDCQVYCNVLVVWLEQWFEVFDFDFQMWLSINFLCIFDFKNKVIQVLLEEVLMLVDVFCEVSCECFVDVQCGLIVLGIFFWFNLWLVWGLDYYSYMVFEIISD